MFDAIASLILSLLEKVGLGFWKEHEAKDKVEDIANAPITKQEESDYFR